MGLRSMEATEMMSPTQAKTADKCSVTLDVFISEVIKKPSAPADHFQQALARVVVLNVGSKVVGEVPDTGGQQGHLNFRRSRIAG